MQKLFALLAISIILSQAYAQNSCGPGAATCSNTTYLTCLSIGWYTNTLSTGVGCSQCNTTNTLTCTSGVNALTCASGYQLVNGVCTACSPNLSAVCQSTCTNSGFFTSGQTCLACASQIAACDSACNSAGFVTVGKTCVPCDKGTVTCKNPTQGLTCVTGYYLATGGVCTQCNIGWASCAVIPVATQCASSYYLSGTSCKACASSSTSSCNPSCLNAGFYSVGSTCVLCAVNSAAVCNSACLSQGFTSTTVTSTGDSPTTTSTCVKCDSNTLGCSVNTNTATPTYATSCAQGYFLGYANSAGVSQCLKCTNQQQLNGWQSNLGSQATCTPSAVPITCQNGFFINQTSCVTCASQVDACATPCVSSGYYTGKNTCLPCQTGASICTNSTISTACFSGYLLVGSSCVQILSGTLTAAFPVTTTPLDGYYLVAGVPTLCSVGQKTCSAPNKVSNKQTLADSCLSGYTNFVAGRTCVQTKIGVLTATVPVPLSCATGYVLSAGTCTVCSDTDSDACYSSSAGASTGCILGYFLTQSGGCDACTGNGKVCISTSVKMLCDAGYFPVSDAAYGACTQGLSNSADLNIGRDSTHTNLCKDGYVVGGTITNGQGTKCVSCGFNAKTCNTDGTKITLCNTGYLLNSVDGLCYDYTFITTTKSTQINGAYTITSITCNLGSADTAGFFWSASSQSCKACATKANFANNADLILGADKIYVCQGYVDQRTDTLLTGYTCAKGYAEFSITGPKLSGCMSCGGVASARILAAGDNEAVTGYVSCTIPTLAASVSTTNYPVSGFTNVKCLTGDASTAGYFLNSDNKCLACATKANFANNADLILGADKIYVCQGKLTVKTGQTSILLTGYTCAKGYAEFSITGPKVSGCMSCGGVASARILAAGDNEAVTGYVSCTIPKLAASVSTANYPISGFTNTVCDTGYYLSDFGKCTQLVNGAATSALITGCADKFYQDSTTKKCISCDGNAATCTDVQANLGVTSCITGYIVTLGVCTKCQAADVNAATCSITTSYANSCLSGYQIISGQCFACPANTNTCNSNLTPTQCDKNYYISAGACKQCGDNKAQTCDSTGPLTCQTNYYLDTASKTCKICANFADTCTATTVTKCQTRYYKSGDNACSDCGSDKYLTCSTSGTAIACISGYGGADCSTQCITGATTCTSTAQTKASGCINGFYNNNAETFNCRSCGQNIATCTGPYTPTTCNSGYVKISSVCVACPGGSSQCTSASIATTCLSTYSLQNGACIKCGLNALTCSGTYASESGCKTGYYFSNGACLACGTGATKCTSNTVATECGVSNYFLDTTNKVCATCGSNAVTCTSATAATLCVSKFYVGSDGACVSCADSNADTCTSTEILKCLTGYSKVTDDKSVASCVKCPDNASACSSSIIATACNSGYTVVGNSCLQCLIGSDKCDAPVVTCQNGYHKVNNACVDCNSQTAGCTSSCSSQGFFSGTASCTRCDANANGCATATTVSGCNSGYYISSTTVCAKCPDGAAACTDASSITSCLTGYFGTTKCTQCGEGANVCLSETLALSCINGYYLGSDSKCSKCSASNAATCSLVGLAVSCASSFYPLNGVCLSCLSTTSNCPAACLSLGYFSGSSSCNPCSSNAISCVSQTQAKSCASGFYLSAAATCAPCSTSVATCNLDFDTTPAKYTCQVGYLQANNTCVACPTGFASCSSATNGTVCRDGFYLAQQWTTCSACPSPAKRCTSANVFQSCLDGYYPTAVLGQDVSCTACPGTNNMINCYNASYATSCKAGFSPINGSCASCPQYSATCNGPLILTCQDRYYIVNQYMAANNTCNACGTGAKTCTSTQAITCLPGYGLNNGVCNQCSIGVEQCPGSITTKCFDSFTLSGGVCSCTAGQGPSADGLSCGSCSLNCATCSSVNQCTQCNNLFTLNGTSCSSTCGANQFYSTSTASKRILQACVDCPKGCASCTSASSCTTCSSGFSLSGSTCNPIFAEKLIGNIFLILALFALMIKQ